MSNCGLHNCDDVCAKTSESLHPSQALWLDRWMSRSCGSTLQAQNEISLHDESRGKYFQAGQGTRAIQIAELSKHKRFDLNAAPCNVSEYRKSWRCQEDIYGVSTVPQTVKAVEVVTEAKRVEITHETLRKNLRNLRSSRLEQQPAALGSILVQNRLVSEKKDGGLQLNDPTPSNFCFPASIGHPGSMIQGLASTELLPSHSCSGQVRNLDELFSGCHSSFDLTPPVHQIDKLRLLSSVDFIEGLSRGPNFSNTSNHLSIRDVCEENQRWKSSTISTKSKERASQGQFTLLPGFSCQDECAEKLQPLGYAGCSEGKIDEGTATPASKNESSAETDVVDINVWHQRNSFPSITPSSSNKTTVVGNNPSTPHSIELRETSGSMEHPFYLDANKDIGNMGLNESRTESLDVEHLYVDQTGCADSSSQQVPILRSNPSTMWVKHFSGSGIKSSDVEHFHANHTGCSNSSSQHSHTLRSDPNSRWFKHFSGRNIDDLDMEHRHVDRARCSKSSPQLSLTLGPDPSSRWVKRLKLSSSNNHTPDTKNVQTGEFSFIPKGDELYNETTYCNRTSSKFGHRELFGGEVEPMVSDKALECVGNEEPVSKEAVKEHREIDLLHNPWIRRWLHNPAPGPYVQSPTPVACEPKSSKIALDVSETKQLFPSIAAMALMGKGILKKCKIENRGSYSVWRD